MRHGWAGHRNSGGRGAAYTMEWGVKMVVEEAEKGRGSFGENRQLDTHCLKGYLLALETAEEEQQDGHGSVHEALSAALPNQDRAKLLQDSLFLALFSWGAKETLQRCCFGPATAFPAATATPTY